MCYYHFSSSACRVAALTFLWIDWFLFPHWEMDEYMVFTMPTPTYSLHYAMYGTYKWYVEAICKWESPSFYKRWVHWWIKEMIQAFSFNQYSEFYNDNIFRRGLGKKVWLKGRGGHSSLWGINTVYLYPPLQKQPFIMLGKDRAMQKRHNLSVYVLYIINVNIWILYLW